MSKIPLSVIVVTKNAGAVLPSCLQALTEFEEVLVVDSRSTDNTREIAEDNGAIYISYEWNGRYPKKRQWCLDNLTLKHDWVFFVDADEVVTEALVKEISSLFCIPHQPAGFFITGQYVWNGKTLKHGLKNRKIALLDRRKMMFPEIDDLDCPGMGEIEGHYQPVLRDVIPSNVEGSGYRIRSLQAPLLHYANHSKEQWRERHKRYAAWEICMNKKGAWPDDPVSWRDAVKKMLRHSLLRPEIAFIHCYILKRGFLDGRAGFDFAASRWKYYQIIINLNRGPGEGRDL